LKSAPVELKVNVGYGNITLKQLLELKKGRCCFSLKILQQTRAFLFIGDKPKFYCVIGEYRKKHSAIKITRLIPETDFG
jgi:flagellar motor switch protein FliM